MTSSPRSLTVAAPRVSRTWLVIAAIAACAACAAAVWLALDSSERGGADRGSARDAALAGAREAANTLTTLDASDPKASIARWRTVTTGALRASVSTDGGDLTRVIETGDVDTSSVVTDAAVSRLDSGARAATVLVAVDLTLEPTTGSPEVQKLRLVVTMKRTADGWKASRLQNVGA